MRKIDDLADWPRTPLISGLIKGVAWRILLRPETVTEWEAQTLAASVAYHIQERENSGDDLYEETEAAARAASQTGGSDHLKN